LERNIYLPDKNSPCHDETVVYHISKLDSSYLFQVIKNKMVNKKEEDMGINSYLPKR